VLFAGQIVAAQSAPSAPASAGGRFEDSTNELSVTVGKSVLVDCEQPIRRVAVGAGEVAEAAAITPTEIMITGKTPGETSLIIWDIHGGRQFFSVTVRATTGAVADSLEAVRRELKAELPDQEIKVSYNNGNVFLRGTVKDLNNSARAVQIATTAGKVVNLLDVTVPSSDPQILLKVRFASVDRGKALSLGINLFDMGLGGAIGGVSTGEYSQPSVSWTTTSTGTTSTVSETNLSLTAYFPNLKSGATIEALENKGVVESLAEPNIIAANGKEASFLAGGEFPYPTISGTSAGSSVNIEFKEYGVRLNFIPTITPRGTIRLQVAPEVSALDYTHEVELDGAVVPGLTERRVNTEVELGDGQSFIIGGLLDKTLTDTFEKIPFLGDIPILGKFFQSESKSKNDTELIVIVTPEIVNPYAANAALPDLKYPDKFMPANSHIPMHQPDEKTAENTPAPPSATMPVEKMVDMLKQEKPLVIDGAGTFGQGGNTSTGNQSSALAGTGNTQQQ
jgi:pilus assembly protein CpaC